jgi:threonine/homoserine/homoserine lactone efflux protein
MPSRIFAFIALVTVIMLIPGPDMTLVIRNGVAGSRTLAFWTGLGTCLGLAMWGVLAVGGLAALIATSGVAYNAVKYAGVAYLMWMGAMSLWHSRAGHATADFGIVEGSAPRERYGGPARTTRSALTQGFLSNALNPKIAVFFLTLLPQFIGKHEPRTRTMIILAATFLAIAIAFYRALSFAVAKFASVLVTGRARLWVERVAGCALIGLGLQVALTS